MEAVAVVGVAAATVQFLDFGVKALVLCKQIRDNGSTDANQQLEHHIDGLKEIYNSLQQVITLPAASRPITRARQECVSVGDELLKLLDTVKTSSRSKNFAAAKAAFLAIKSRREIEKLQNRLADSQKRFLAAVSAETLKDVARILEEQGKTNDTIRDVLIPEVRQGRAESSQKHSKTHAGLSELRSSSSAANDRTHSQLCDVQKSQQALHKAAQSSRIALGRDHLKTHRDLTKLTTASSVAHHATHSRLRDMHQGQQSSFMATERMQTSLSKDFAKLGTGIGEQLVSAEITAKRKEVMESLWYPEMFDRQQTIKPPSRGTFEWIFDDSPPIADPKQDEDTQLQAHMRGIFARWLRNDDPLFWISGKAGSGKSSLMSLIQDDPRTTQALSFWAKGRQLYTFSFYFWRPGSALQKSIPGLLRSLLYQLAKAKPAVVDIITSVKPATYNDWTTKSLLSALQKSLTAFREDRIFLMIDGLDEYNGQDAELLDIVLKRQNEYHVKACLASRPEAAIIAKLENFPTLRLQDLNRRDISHFVRDKLRSYEDILTERLISDLISRAEGVFLWAALVLRSMISGCLAGDDAATLSSRLDATPKELAQLFEQLLQNVEKVHQESLSLCLFHLQSDRGSYRSMMTSIGLITASLPIGREVNSSDEFANACTRTAVRLVAQWKGLVEIAEESRGWWKPLDSTTNPQTYAWYEDRIKFLHRSAYDYFFGPEGNVVHSQIPWLLRDSDLERMTWMTLNGLLLLLQQALVLSHRALKVPNIGPCATDAVLLAKSAGLELTQDFFEWLDGLCANFCASFDARLVFWTTVSLNLGAYTESRWDKLMNDSQPRVMCAEIVFQLCHEAEYEYTENENAVDHQILQLNRRLMEHLRKTHQRPTSTSIVHTHFTITDVEFYSNDFPGSTSWITRGYDEEEAAIIHILGKLDYHKRCVSDCMRDYLALLYEWEVYYGVQGKDFLPLHLQASAKPENEGLKRPSMRYRIVCLPRGIIDDIMSTSKPIVVPVAGLLDLSTDSAKRLSKFCYFEVGMRFPRFLGDPSDFRNCLAMILKEVWANMGGGLTAWQQLYMLACVKTWFLRYWDLNDLEVSSGGLTDDDEYNSSVQETSDDLAPL